MRSEATRESQAIRDCLCRCSASPAPLAALASYVDELRANPAWTAEEVRIFELDALRVLIKVMAEPAWSEAEAR